MSALERLLPGVQTHVHLEVGLFYRSLRAVRAPIDLDLSALEVPLFEVPLQALVAGIATAASAG